MQEVISKHSWTSAVSRAAGEKVNPGTCGPDHFVLLAACGYRLLNTESYICPVQVLDNPKLLKSSMKREKQQKVKSTKKW